MIVSTVRLSAVPGHAGSVGGKKTAGRMRPAQAHLRKRRGCSVACSNALSVASSNIISLVSGIVQRIVTFPVDVHWNCPMDFQTRHANRLLGGGALFELRVSSQCWGTPAMKTLLGKERVDAG